MISTNKKKIRQIVASDIPSVADVHSQSFTRQLNSIQWITCNFNAQPRVRIYVAQVDDIIVGYIQWIEKSGFREEVVLELEQIAVLPTWRNQGLGRDLINQSLVHIEKELAGRNAFLKHVLVTTRTDNFAQKIYIENLGVSEEAVIKDLFSADEVIMIARDVTIRE